MPARLRSNDPTLRDDPLVNQGDASVLRPVTAGIAASQAHRAEGPSRSTAKEEAGSGDVVIDVIVAYTKKAASYYADVRRELVELAIEEANQSFRIERPRPRQAAARARLPDRLRGGRRALRPRVALCRQGRRLHGGNPWPARQVPGRCRGPDRRRPEGLRACDARVCRCRRGVCRGASRMRGRDLLAGARDRPPHRRAPRAHHGQES